MSHCEVCSARALSVGSLIMLQRTAHGWANATLSPFAHNATPPALHQWPESMSCKPRFMIIGSPKCGSTSLFKYLEAHPDVRQPRQKELCYFSTFKRYLTRYRPSHVTDWQQYVAGFAGSNGLGMVRPTRRRGRNLKRARRLLEQLVGIPRTVLADACRAGRTVAFEGCPFYLHEHLAASQIFATFPQLRAVAVLRNPRERSVSAFNDYVRMRRIRAASSSTGRGAQMQAMVEKKIQMLRSGARALEDFDLRILTSGVYIYGLREWGRVWPARQLLVVQSEDMFDDAEAAVHRVLDFVGLRRAIPAEVFKRVHNRNPLSDKAHASAELNRILDTFFAPYNEQFYGWMEERSMPYKRWPNGSATVASGAASSSSSWGNGTHRRHLSTARRGHRAA